MPNPIRVFFPYVGGDQIGGSHISSLSLVAALDRARFEPIIALHRESGDLGEYISSLGLDYQLITEPCIIAPSYSRSDSDASLPKYLTRSVPRFVRILKELNIDIVTTNDGRMHANWALPARLAGTRFVWYHRQGPDASGINKIAPIFANKILSVSEFARPIKPIRPIDDRFEVVRSPFDFSSDPPEHSTCHAALCSELGLPENAVLLGYFGLLNTRKRPDHFVRAVAEISAAIPDRPVHGVVFGQEETADIGLADTCHDLARTLGITEQVRLMGHRSPIAEAMAGVDALLVTALGEPFGRTLIEAMHLGTPVVATNHGGNPEAIENGRSGFLVDPYDPSAFVDPVRQLLESPDLKKSVTAAARDNVHQSMSRDVHVARVSSIYESLVKRRGLINAA